MTIKFDSEWGGRPMKDKLILSFSIGPVQGFIAQARKTKDSLSGSRILSDLTDAALERLNDCQIVLPDKSIDSKPNRFVAIIEKENAKAFIDEIEFYVREEFLQIALKTYKDVFRDTNYPKGFKEQIENFLSIYWAALDYDENNYSFIYNELDSLVGSIKNARIFSQINYNSEPGEAGKKCNICGERNNIFGKRNGSNILRIVDDCHIGENEGLCAVCFTKRYYKKSKTESFPSTSHISLLNILKRRATENGNLNDKACKNCDTIWDYIKCKSENKDFTFVAELLYEENINVGYITENGIEREGFLCNEEQNLKDIKNIREMVKNEAHGTGLNLPKYYGIISFDGDDMGKWFSGERIDESKISLLDFHKKLTLSLGEFAKEAQNKVVEPKGKIIYAGGEDFLAFLNLEYLFSVMGDLRERFDSMINQPLKKYYKDPGLNISFSAGICISHYKTTLSNSIVEAEKAQKRAKDIDGKNAFSISLMKRSGEIELTSYKWQENGEIGLTIVKDCELVLDNIKNGYFSTGFIYNIGKVTELLPDEFNILRTRDLEAKEKIDEIMQVEISRLLNRARDRDKVEKDGKSEAEVTKEMEETVLSMYKKSTGEVSTGVINNNKTNFLNLLYILEFIKREIYYDN